MVPGLCYIHRDRSRAAVCVAELADDAGFFVREDGRIQILRWRDLHGSFVLVGREDQAAAYQHSSLEQLREDTAAGVFLHALALALAHGPDVLEFAEL